MCQKVKITELIVKMVRVKSALYEADGGFWPYHFPEIKASSEDVKKTEGSLGITLPRQYRDFLLHANGWRGFFQTIDLLGCQQLQKGMHIEYFWQMYSALRPEEWGHLGLDPGRLLPIGVTLEDRDAFVINLKEGSVVWIAGSRVDDWPNFSTFFESMIEYNKLEIMNFLNKRDEAELPS